MARKEWGCKVLGIETAFLQGNELKRGIYLKPPKEAKTQGMWKLNKAVYSLNEASQYWCEGVKVVLIITGMLKPKYDEALFCWKLNGNVQGIIAIHVYDFLYGGSDQFEVEIMKQI